MTTPHAAPATVRLLPAELQRHRAARTHRRRAEGGGRRAASAAVAPQEAHGHLRTRWQFVPPPTIRWSPIPVTYAGGARNLEDCALIDTLGGGKVDVTIGSALDIFGGALPYQSVVEWDAAQAEAALQPPAVCPFHMPAGVLPGWRVAAVAAAVLVGLYALRRRA